MNKRVRTFAKLNYFTCILFLITGVLGVNAWSSVSQPVSGQEKAEDKVVKHLPYANQPVEIGKVNVKGKAIKFNAKIDLNEDDWLNNLSVTVKNVSDKTITHIMVYLEFPETKATGNIMFFPLMYGQNPRAPIVSGQPEALPVAQTTSLSISGDTLNKLTSLVEKRQPLNSLRKVTIHLNTVYFEDGSLWTGGSFFRPDPINPTKYVRVEN